MTTTTTATTAGSRWVSRPREDSPPTGPTVITFPWTGAGTAAYRSRTPLPPAATDLVTPQLLSRGTRRHEPTTRKLAPPADEVTAAIIDTTTTTTPIVLFGHSYGALLVLAVAVRLQDLGDWELLAKLVEMCGIPPRLQRQQPLLRTSLPGVRADSAATDTYYPDQPATRTCPLHASVMTAALASCVLLHVAKQLTAGPVAAMCALALWGCGFWVIDAPLTGRLAHLSAVRAPHVLRLNASAVCLGMTAGGLPGGLAVTRTGGAALAATAAMMTAREGSRS